MWHQQRKLTFATFSKSKIQLLCADLVCWKDCFLLIKLVAFCVTLNNVTIYVATYSFVTDPNTVHYESPKSYSNGGQIQPSTDVHQIPNNTLFQMPTIPSHLLTDSSKCPLISSIFCSHPIGHNLISSVQSSCSLGSSMNSPIGSSMNSPKDPLVSKIPSVSHYCLTARWWYPYVTSHYALLVEKYWQMWRFYQDQKYFIYTSSQFGNRSPLQSTANWSKTTTKNHRLKSIKYCIYNQNVGRMWLNLLFQEVGNRVSEIQVGRSLKNGSNMSCE